MGVSTQLLHQRVHPLQRRDGSLEIVGLLAHVGHPVLDEVQVLHLPGVLHAEQERNRGVSERSALRAGHPLHHRDTLDGEHALGQLVEHQEVRGVAHVVIGFDQQHLRQQARFREVPRRGRPAEVGKRVLRDERRVLVAHLVAGQREQADQRDRAGGHEDGAGPAHDRCAHLAPASVGHLAPRFEQPAASGDSQHRWDQRQRDRHRDQHADRTRHTHGLKHRQPGEAQAERGARDGQARGQHHMGDAAIRGEVRRLRVFMRHGGLRGSGR